MGKQIVYGGPSSKDDPSTEFHIETVDEDGKAKGKTYELREGIPVEVPDELASELLTGSERTEGHKFEEYEGKRKSAPQDVAPPAPSESPNPSGTGR